MFSMLILSLHPQVVEMGISYFVTGSLAVYIVSGVNTLRRLVEEKNE